MKTISVEVDLATAEQNEGKLAASEEFHRHLGPKLSGCARLDFQVSEKKRSEHYQRRKSELAQHDYARTQCRILKRAARDLESDEELEEAIVVSRENNPIKKMAFSRDSRLWQLTNVDEKIHKERSLEVDPFMANLKTSCSQFSSQFLSFL